MENPTAIHSKSIAEMATHPSLFRGEVEEAFEHITRSAAHHLQVDRASVWLLQKDSTELVCLKLYEKSRNQFSSGSVLKTAQYPKYFEAFLQNKYLDANNIRTDSRTQEFNESYSIPLNIYSLLDGAIYSQGNILGVVCLEQTERTREWKEDEIHYVLEVANLVGILWANYQQKQAENTLQEISQVVSANLGQAFFESLVTHLANSLGAEYALVGKLAPDDSNTVQSLSFYSQGKIIDNISYGLEDSPCSNTFQHHLCIYNQGVQQKFPKDKYLVNMEAQGYAGVRLLSSQGEQLGVIALVFQNPIKNVEKVKTLLNIFAARAAAELERMIWEEKLQELNTELDQQVKLRTQELNGVNQELEAFCYSASHDLRAPLRRIMGFIEAMKEDFHETLPSQCVHYLERINQSSQQMHQLVDELLSLSHLNQTEMHLEEVDLSRIFSSLFKQKEQREPSRQIQWEVEPDLVVLRGDRILLQSAIENLISNAWKFTEGKEEGKIKMGKTEVNGEPCFYIQDNGAGFNPRYQDKLFIPFQRLHTNQEFKGNGIGLASAKRIIHRHGGKIWATGKEGEGATFYFAFPHIKD